MRCKLKYLLFALQMLKKNAVRFMGSQTVKWGMEARNQLRKKKKSLKLSKSISRRNSPANHLTRRWKDPETLSPRQAGYPFSTSFPGFPKSKHFQPLNIKRTNLEMLRTTPKLFEISIYLSGMLVDVSSWTK